MRVLDLSCYLPYVSFFFLFEREGGLMCWVLGGVGNYR